MSFAPIRFLTLLLAAWLLASCGGGTSQVVAYQPPRVLAFGDELSAFTSDGRKWAVNALTAGTQNRDCTLLPLWIQVVAGLWNYGFEQCPLPTGQQKAFTRAAPGARAADVVRQIDAQVAAGGLQNEDLALVLVGVNDVLELYGQRDAKPREELVAEARRRGEVVAQQVNRLVGLGARVIVSTIPDMGLSPFGLAQGAAAAQLLSELSAAVNGRIRVNILNDGRFVGLVLADELVQVANRAPGIYSLANATQAVCTAALPDCTTATVLAEASASLYLWADDRWLADGGHRQLGALAAARAQLNPF